MALNLANDDDGGSQMEVAQKDSAESYPGTESTLIVLLSLFVCLVSSEKNFEATIHVQRVCSCRKIFEAHLSTNSY